MISSGFVRGRGIRECSFELVDRLGLARRGAPFVRRRDRGRDGRDALRLRRELLSQDALEVLGLLALTSHSLFQLISLLLGELSNHEIIQTCVCNPNARSAI